MTELFMNMSLVQYSGLVLHKSTLRWQWTTPCIAHNRNVRN